MASRQIIATRQELLRLKNKHKSAKRGHKLLKDKRDSLMQKFLQIYRETIAARQDFETEYSQVLGRIGLALSDLNENYLRSLAENSTTEIALSREFTSSLGVKLADLQAEISGDYLNYSLAATNHHFDITLYRLNQLLPDLMQLISKEFKLRKLAAEIEKTRRRVNALEYVVMPQLKSDIRYVRHRLEEQALQTTVRLMKMKQMISEEI